MRHLFLSLYILSFSSALHALTLNGFVSRIKNAEQLEFRDTSGQVIVLGLAGLKIPGDPTIRQQTEKRMQTLLLGKEIQADIHINPDRSIQAILSSGGLNFNLRLLQEGLALVAPDGITKLGLDLASFSNAEKQARENSKGIWQKQMPFRHQRIYQPRWFSPGIPEPIQSAPVFIPEHPAP